MARAILSLQDGWVSRSSGRAVQSTGGESDVPKLPRPRPKVPAAHPGMQQRERQSRYWISPASVSRFCWNLAMLSKVVFASCLPVMARSNWSCCSVSNSKNCGTCHTSFCQSSEGAHALFHGRYVTYFGSEYTDLTADWPPAAANWCWMSDDSHHFTNSTASLIWDSVVQVVSTKGWPPMFDQRTILPSA